MKISDLIKMGLRNLGRRKARTALTVVGIVIGTISIVVMVSIGVGMNQSFREQLLEFGSVTAITMNKNQYSYDASGNYEGESKQKLDDKLIEKLKAIPHVKSVSPLIVMNFKLKSGSYETNTQVNVMDASAFAAMDFPALKNGGDYTKSSSRAKMKVWAGSEVFSYFHNTMSQEFRPKKIDPEKARITMAIDDYELQSYDDKGNPTVTSKEYSTEVEIFDAKEYSEYSWTMYMDKSQFINIYKEHIKQLPADKRRKAEKKLKEYDTIRINADSMENVKAIQDTIKEMGYKSSSMSDMTQQLENFSKTVQMVLGGVGAVAMLVAAISIANTMIMSIYERTKEIGVMKVLGCQISDIKRLFLFEAAMLGLIGGIIGIILSYGASAALNSIGGGFGSLLGIGGENSKLSIIPIWLPVMAASFAMMVGVVSGYYPASRATKISAIEAMKNE